MGNWAPLSRVDTELCELDKSRTTRKIFKLVKILHLLKILSCHQGHQDSIKGQVFWNSYEKKNLKKMWPMILKFKPYVPLLGGWGVAEIKKIILN